MSLIRSAFKAARNVICVGIASAVAIGLLSSKAEAQGNMFKLPSGGPSAPSASNQQIKEVIKQIDQLVIAQRAQKAQIGAMNNGAPMGSLEQELAKNLHTNGVIPPCVKWDGGDMDRMVMFMGEPGGPKAGAIVIDKSCKGDQVDFKGAFAAGGQLFQLSGWANPVTHKANIRMTNNALKYDQTFTEKDAAAAYFMQVGQSASAMFSQARTGMGLSMNVGPKGQTMIAAGGQGVVVSPNGSTTQFWTRGRGGPTPGQG